MNILGFVLSILLLLSLGAAMSFEKQISGRRLHSSYLGHIAANRDILNQSESEFYASLKQSISPNKDHRGLNEEAKDDSDSKAEDESLSLPSVNPYCARINLYPLIEQGREGDPFLYEAVAQLLKAFYGKELFANKNRAEYKFLETFLQVVRTEIAQQRFFCLEKVAFPDPQLQSLYYKMLKGTHRSNFFEGVGFPSFLDYIKVDPAASKICIHHAHPNLLAIFFTPKGAQKIYTAIHTSKAPALTQESIERICQEVHAALLDSQIFSPFEIHLKHHSKIPKTTFLGNDQEHRVSLRKVLVNTIGL